jgi:hypothetical protein
MRQRGWNLIWLFAYGAIGGTALDALHVISGIERYAMPVLFGLLAWWVPLLFGGASLAIGTSHPLLDSHFGSREQTRTLIRSSAELGWLVLAYLLSAGPLPSLVKVGLLALVFLVFWLLAGRGWSHLLLAAMTAGVGTGIEVLLVHVGAFSYLQPDLGGVPFWLPCLYLYASLAVGNLGRVLHHRSPSSQNDSRLPRELQEGSLKDHS